MAFWISRRRGVRESRRPIRIAGRRGRAVATLREARPLQRRHRMRHSTLLLFAIPSCVIATHAPAADIAGGGMQGTVHAGESATHGVDLHAGKAVIAARTQVADTSYGNGVYDLELLQPDGTRVATTALVATNGRSPTWDPYTWHLDVPADGHYVIRLVNQEAAPDGKTLRYTLEVE
jgi:hypothetical protein